MLRRFTLAVLLLFFASTLLAYGVVESKRIPVRVVDSTTYASDVVQDGEETAPTSGTTGTPVLHFSDLISGPDTGLGDGLGSGAIVTVWGQHIGSSQGSSAIEYCDSASVCRAGHVYYWKNADGTLPSGPANLYESHGMQEIAFSIPDSALGVGNIRVRVGANTTSLPFIVRSGNIYHVSPSGSDSNPGTFAQPWATAGRVGHTQSGGTTAPAGSTVYFHGVTAGGVSSSRGIYINNSAATAPDATTNFFLTAYPGAHSTASGQEGFTNYQIAGTAISKFKIEASNCTEIANGQISACNPGGTWGVRTDRWGRVIANYITDQPGRCADRYQAAITGAASGEDDVSNVKIYGNEIEEYGCNSTNPLHHTTYMTVRSAPADTTVDPWEFGWNYLHDNHAKGGIHQFDQDDGCGDTSGPIVIRNNVVINQAGAGVSFASQCNWTMDAYIENNVIINAAQSVDWDGIDPETGSQVEPGGIVIRDSGVPPLGGLTGTMYVRNNIIHGAGWENATSTSVSCLLFTGSADNVSVVFTDNICFNTRDYKFIGATNSASQMLDNISGSRNTFYYGGAGTPTQAIVPTFDNNPITTNPLLTISGSRITVDPSSPVKNQSSTLLLRDVYGVLRPKPNSSTGAVE